MYQMTDDGKITPASFDGSGEPGEAWLIYDNECLFCRTYVKYLRVRDAIGRLHLVNARDGGPLVEEVRNANLDLDEGMVLKIGGKLYHGSDCIHVLACLSSPSDLYNRVNALIFRSYTLSHYLYPVLRSGRNAVLKLLGRSRIN